MKVDVYPNITNVEVYENPISVPVEATWEKVAFTIPNPVVNTYDLGRQVATDRDGDYVIQVYNNSALAKYGDDFTVTNTQINWVSDVALVAGEELLVWYSPKSAYGSVPGSGEVSSLTHLNDVTIAGPLAGHMLMRDGDGQFVNRHLTAGDNVTITSNGDGVTIAASAGDIATASTIAEGKVRLATLAESSGNSNTLAVTPAGLQAEISSIASTDLSDSADLARLASPNLTGTPTAPTPAFGDDSTKLATTAYVQDEIAGLGSATSVGNAGNVNVADGNGSFSSTTWEVSNNHLLPTADDTYDIGSPTRKVRDIYVGNNSLKLGDNNTPLRVNANGDLEFGTDEVLTDATLATVATSGQYADLLGAPTLSNVATSGEYADLTGAPTLSTVATSGEYADLSGAPTLSNVATSGDYADLSGTPTVSTVGSTGQYADLLGAPTLSNVATSGSYADLSGTPTLSTVANTGDYDDLIGAPTLSNVATSGAYADLSGAPTLSTVATSGSYNDLSDKPAIPSASTDLSDTADLARLASPSFTGTPTAPTPSLGDDSTKIATTAYVQDELTNLGGVNSLDDLSDVALSGTLSAGEVVRYSGTAWVDSTLASTDLSDSADLARLASPNLTGNPTAPTPAGSDNSTSIATTAYVQTEITNMSTVDTLNDLSDVTISGTQSAGEILRYSGTGWEDSALASTDLSDSGQLVRSSDVGTAAAENIGTTIGDVVQLENVSGSAGLPAVDASQLTGLSATQVGALANINNESLTDLSDVNFTAGAGIDGFSLVYNHGNTRWEASEVTGGATTILLDSTNVTQIGGTNNAEITVTAGNNYIIDPSVANVANLSYIFFILPLSNVTDPASTTIVNLSSLDIFAYSSSDNRLYDALGDAAPYIASLKTGYYFRYGRGTLNLHQSDISTTNAKWYAYFDYAVENQSEPTEGEGVSYSVLDRAFINVGHVFGEYELTSDVSATLIRAGRKYVTAYDESAARTVTFGNPHDHFTTVQALDGKTVFFENRGTSTLTIDRTSLYTGGVYYRSEFYDFDKVLFNPQSKTLAPGESAAIVCEYDPSGAVKLLKLYFQKGGHNPQRVIETDNSATNSTIVCDTELHKVIYVDNGATAVTMTVPDSADLREGYELTLKVLGTGAVTIARSGTNTFDGDTSLTLGEKDQLTLIKSASGWAILTNDSETTPTSLVSDTDPTLGGDLDVSTFDIVSSSGNNIEVAPDGSGKLIVKGNATGGSAGITLNCEANTHGVTIKSPPHASNATYTLTLPDDAGSANELLKTNGSGGLSWSLVGGNDVVVPHTGVNYSAANTDHVTTHLSAIDTALASAGGASDLNGLSDVTITAAAAGEILRYNGANWVDATLSIVDDTSPSLGGDLDLNGNGISSHLVPSTANRDIGSSSAEWRNLYLADGGKIRFGLDQDVELIHDPDDGLILELGVADGNNDPQFELKSQTSGSFGARLTFTTESTTPASYDRVGQLLFVGKDSAGNLQDYGYIYGQIHDPTSGAEAGKVSILAYPASANTRGLHVEGIAGNASGAKVNIDHNPPQGYGLHLNNTLVTSTATELNLLDGGSTVGNSITIADTDGFIINDGGVSKLIPASDVKSYAAAGASAASETVAGVIEIATNAEATAATATDKALVPSNLGSIALTSLNDDLGSTYQALDAGLTSISGLTTSANQLIYTTASDTYATASLTAAGRALLDDADAAAQRATLGAIAELSDDSSPQLSADLDLNGQDIVTTSNADLDLAPHGTGVVVVRGNQTGGNNQGAIKLNCEQNSHGVTIKSPAHASGASYTLTLPVDDGDADQVLKTDGSGVLAWVDQSSGGSAPNVTTDSSGTNTTISTSTGIEEIHLISNAGNNVVITIPAAGTAGSGYKYQIKRLGTGTCSITPASGTIDGASSFSLASQFDSVTLVSNGSNYFII